MKQQQHTNSQACFYQIYSLPFIKKVSCASISNFVNNLMFFSGQLTSNESKYAINCRNCTFLTIKIAKWPWALSFDLHDLDISLSLTLTLQNPGSFILQLGLWKKCKWSKCLVGDHSHSVWKIVMLFIDSAVAYYKILSLKLAEIAQFCTK